MLNVGDPVRLKGTHVYRGRFSHLNDEVDDEDRVLLSAWRSPTFLLFHAPSF
jgi:hypothetical protein